MVLHDGTTRETKHSPSRHCLRGVCGRRRTCLEFYFLKNPKNPIGFRNTGIIMETRVELEEYVASTPGVIVEHHKGLSV